MLPANQWVEFHVTSLDVIHSFWAYQLGVKADANPGVDNVAYTKINNTGEVVVRCAELCGLWHGAMFDYGQVDVRRARSRSGRRATEASWPRSPRCCPPYATDLRPDGGPADDQDHGPERARRRRRLLLPDNAPVSP